jgi:hypothetical protein
MIRATSTTANVIIMFLFLSDPSNIAIAVSLSEVLPGSGSLASKLTAVSSLILMGVRNLVSQFAKMAAPVTIRTAPRPIATANENGTGRP